MWLATPRAVYRVVEARPGRSLTVEDLARKERVEIGEPALSRHLRPGEAFCSRALADGSSTRLIPDVVLVGAGDEEELLEVLAGGDPRDILLALGEREERLGGS
jgi:hypothetical protein